MDNLIQRLRYERDDGARDEAADELSRLRAENASMTLERQPRQMAEKRNAELLAENAKQAERIAELEEELICTIDFSGPRKIKELQATLAAQSAALAGAKEKFKRIDDVLVSLHSRKGTHVCAAELRNIEEIASKALAAIAAIAALPTKSLLIFEQISTPERSEAAIDKIDALPKAPACDRDAVIEECARVAWNYEPDENGPIETAIRALKSQPADDRIAQMERDAARWNTFLRVGLISPDVFPDEIAEIIASINEESTPEEVCAAMDKIAAMQSERGEVMKLRDKWGWPVTTFKKRPVVNFIRYLIHTNIRQTWRLRNHTPSDSAFTSVMQSEAPDSHCGQDAKGDK